MYLNRILAVALVLITATPLSAITITSNLIISAENSFPGETLQFLDGENPPTVVQMLEGGEARRLSVDHHSILNMYGGDVTELVDLRGQSTAHLFGGTIARFSLRGATTANFHGTQVLGDIVLGSSLGPPTLNFYDGVARDVIGAATFNIHGGQINQLSVIGGAHVVNITGGSMRELVVAGSSDVHWSGGEVRSVPPLLGIRQDVTLNIYGRDLSLDSDKFLSGTLLDGTNVDGYFIRHVDNSRVIFHNVPEPGTLALSGLAVLIVATSLSHTGRRGSIMRTIMQLSAVLATWFLATPLSAITITSNLIISAENSFPGETLQFLDGENPPTVVQMLEGGEAAKLALDDHSILNLHGGEVTQVVDMRGYAVANFFGGAIAGLRIRGGTIATFHGTRVEGDVSFLDWNTGTPTFNFYDGVVKDVVGHGRAATFNIHGGRIDELFVRDSRHIVNITGGSLETMVLGDESVTHWSGGALRIFPPHFFLHEDAVLNVYGRGLSLDSENQFAGTLLDGTDITGYRAYLGGAPKIILHNVPEPAAFTLCAVVSVLCFSFRHWGARAAA